MESNSILPQEHCSKIYNIFLHCDLQKALNLHNHRVQKRQSVIPFFYGYLFQGKHYLANGLGHILIFLPHIGQIFRGRPEISRTEQKLKRLKEEKTKIQYEVATRGRLRLQDFRLIYSVGCYLARKLELKQTLLQLKML